MASQVVGRPFRPERGSADPHHTNQLHLVHSLSRLIVAELIVLSSSGPREDDSVSGWAMCSRLWGTTTINLNSTGLVGCFHLHTVQTLLYGTRLSATAFSHIGASRDMVKTRYPAYQLLGSEPMIIGFRPTSDDLVVSEYLIS